MDRYRGDEIIGEQYHVIKYNQIDMESGLYTVTLSEIANLCDCPAGQKPTCRHRELVETFIKKKYVDRNDVRYNFDKKEFTIFESVNKNGEDAE